MEFSKGDIRIFSIKKDLVYVPVGCLISNGLDESTQTLNTTTRASNGWKTSLPTTQEYRIPFEGIQVLSDTSIISYDEIKTYKRSRTRIEWQISGGNFPTDQGNGYIIGLSEGNAVGELLTFSGEVEGYGEPVVVQITGDLFQDGEVMLFQDGNEMIFQ